MEYISTDFEKSDIKHGTLTESPLRGSTARYICNPIVDNIEADPKEEYQPPSCLVVGKPSINDLTSWLWQGRTVDSEPERELVRRIQEGDPRCRAGSPRSCSCRSCRAFFDPRPKTISLLPAFHHSIRKIAGGYVPKRGQRRSHKRESESLLFQEFMAVGCFGLLKAAMAFDFDRSYRLWTIAQPKIDGLISNEANYLRQKGHTSGDTVGRYSWKQVGQRTQTRLDRWIFDHLGSPPEELLEAQKKLVKQPLYHSLEEAVAAIKAAHSLDHSDVYSDDGKDGGGDVPDTAATEPLEEFRELYDSAIQLKWSPQLVVHRDIVSPIVDFWIRELCDPPRIKAKLNPKPVYNLCTAKPTGRLLHPIANPYWMEGKKRRIPVARKSLLFFSPSLSARPKEYAGTPYDPDRREKAVIRFKNGTTKRVYRQMASSRGRHIKVTAKLNAKYSAMIEPNEPKRKRNVRPNRNQKTGSPTAEIIVLESRRSGGAGLHLSEHCNPPCIGERFAGAWIARGR